MSVPANLKYTEEHEWLRIEGDHATVGITDHAQQQLGDVVYVDLPEVGRAVSKGETFGTVESVKAVSDLFAPLAGTVAEVNKGLIEGPDAVNSDPYGKAWMIKIKLGNSGDAAALLSAADYEKLLASLA
jgi:glycine cleavage system H protein